MAEILGTSGADSLAGTEDADILLGRGGADRLDGQGGGDLVLGGAADDSIFGEVGGAGLPYPPPPGGNDVLLGGAGNDTIFGGGRLGSPEDGNDLILGGPGSDLLDGGGADNTVLGGTGDDDIANASLALGGTGGDRITGTLGSDTLLGGAGADSINGFGVLLPVSFRAFPEIQQNESADLLLGGAGRDAIRGGGGADTILGGVGDDILAGEFGADRLTGGPGADHFLFWPIPAPFRPPVPDTGLGEGSRHIVSDFEQGRDRLDFSGYDDPARYTGQAPPPWPEPVFLGSAAFTASTGLQVRSEILPDNRTLVQFVAPRPFAGPDPGLPNPTGEVELAGRIRLRPEDLLLLGPERSDEHGRAPDLPAAAETWLGFA